MKSPERDPELRNILRILRRRKTTIFSSIAVVFLVFVVLLVSATRRYSASAEIELQKANSNSLGLDSMMGGGASDSFDDPMILNVDIQTESTILKSDTLAIPVIEKLKLESDPDFKPKFSLVGSVLKLISPKPLADPVNAPLQRSPARRERVLATFRKNLKVRAVAGTRLIEVSYQNPRPEVAAAVVNELVQELIDYTFQVRFTATNQTSRWLEGQLNDLREKSESLQARVVALQKSTGLFGVGGTDPSGKPNLYSPALDQLQEATAQLSQAESNRILKGSIYQAVRSGDGELISQLSGTSGSGVGGAGVSNSLGLIQTLRAQEATAQAQLEQDSVKYGPRFPKLVEDAASLRRVQQALQDEIRRVGSRAKNDYEIAQRSEQGARASYAQRRRAADSLNDKAIEYIILQKEATQSQELYQNLLSKLREAGVLAGLRSSNLTTVQPATPPSTPSSPKTLVYLLGGLGLGTLIGLSGSLLVDLVDNRVHSAEDVELLDMPLIGLIPGMPATQIESQVPLVEQGHSAYGEAIRRLRSTLLLSRSMAPPRVILVASGSPGEGKSTVCLNLAVAFAQMNRRVLLVEIDMRRPVLQKRLRLTQAGGLSQLLSGYELTPERINLPDTASLSLIAGGPIPPYPSELLSSNKFGELMEDWKREYDVVLIDSPPVLPVTDVQSVAGYADVTILLARSGQTTRTSLQRSFNMLLPHTRPSSIGVLLNAVPVKSSAYHEYYGYRQTGYYRQ